MRPMLFGQRLTFMDSYKAYSGAYIGKKEIEEGNKSKHLVYLSHSTAKCS